MITYLFHYLQKPNKTVPGNETLFTKKRIGGFDNKSQGFFWKILRGKVHEERMKAKKGEFWQ